MQDDRINYLVYEGKHYTVELYFDQNGDINIWDDIQNLTLNEKAKLQARVEIIADSVTGTMHPKTIFNLEDSKEKIFAIKFGDNRFCSFFYNGKKIIITNAYKKQTQKNGKREQEQIKKSGIIKYDYENRVKNKKYYPKENTYEKK